MERFQHMMRTTQHAKSVQMIMTRTNNHFSKSKIPHKKPSAQGDNITTYLRKFQIDRQNLNLAKRIMQCQSQHSRDRYTKEWQKIKRFIQVRSNFKKTLHAQQPKIYRFEPILGKGKLRVDINFRQIQIPWLLSHKKNLYKFVYMIGNNEVQPDQKLITLDFIKNYTSSFYAPSFLKKKKITCKILQVSQNNTYQAGRFSIDFSNPAQQQSEIMSRLGKSLGIISFHLKLQGGRKKKHKKSSANNDNKQNQWSYQQNYNQSCVQTQGQKFK